MPQPPQLFINYIGYGDFTGDGGIDKITDRLTGSGNGDGTAFVNIFGGGETQWGIDTTDDEFGQGILGIGDFDGDGKSDLVTKNQTVWRSTGTAFTGQITWSVPNLTGTTVDTADINGDGKADMLLGKKTLVGATNYWQITPYLSTGAKFIARTPLNLSTDTGGNDTSILLGDVNGDGRSDLIRVFNYDTEPGFTGQVYGITVYLSNGATLVAGAPEQKFGGFFEASEDAVRLADINGDGRIDLLLSDQFDHINDDFGGVFYQGQRNRFRFYLSNGSGFAATAHQFNDWIAQVGDYNGDGRIDFVLHEPVTNNIRLSTGGGAPPDLLTGIVEPLGGKIAIAYESSANKPNQKLQFVLPIVKSVTLDDGRIFNGAPIWLSQTTFDYTAGLWDAAERQFFGFLTVAAQLPAIETETIGPKQVTTFVQTLPCLGKASLIESFDGAGTLLRSVVNTYSPTSGGSETGFKCHNLTTTTNEIIAGQTKTTKIERTFDQFGNQSSQISRGDLAFIGDERFDRTIYYNDVYDYIVSCSRFEETYLGTVAGILA